MSPSDTPQDPHYLTVQELMVRWRVSKTFVYDLLAQCRLPYTKIGRCLRVKLADVEAYERAGTVEAVPLPRVLRLLPRQPRRVGRKR